MKRLIIIFLSVVLNTGAFSQINVEKYLWEYPLQRELNLNQDLVDELRLEMQKILDAGNLFFRPLSCRYSDQIFEHYAIYQEPGRVLNTIAMAYPFLTADQQNSLRSMVAALLADNVHSPWAASPLSMNAGNPREIFPYENVWGLGSDFGLYRPTIQNVYSLWQYIYRTGDTITVQPYYNTIRSFYNNKVGVRIDPGNLYGTMSSHIGMARLAQMFDDADQVATASGNLLNYLTLGLEVEYVDSMAFYGYQGWNAPYGSEYDSRRDGWVYRGYIFLNLSAEIGRYLQDTLYEEISVRHLNGINRFPFWWMRQSAYFTRWTGDEGVGLPSEMMGMVVPLERWVMGQTAATLTSYMLSSPVGIADSYWIEALVYAIEADSEDEWVDIRDTHFMMDAGRMIWTGTVSENWFDPANWDMNRVPTIHDEVLIRNAPFKALISQGLQAFAKRISIEPGAQVDVQGALQVSE